MGGKFTSYEDLTGKTSRSQESTNALGRQPTTREEAGTVSFEELVGRGQGYSTGATSKPRSRPNLGENENTAAQTDGDADFPATGRTTALQRGKGGAASKQFGLNFLHTYWQKWSGPPTTGSVVTVAARRYGGETAPYEDAGILGATVVRQIGLRDLMWSVVAFSSATEDDFMRGQEVELDVVSQLLTRARIDTGTDNATWLAEALTAAHQAGVKVLFTFGSMSGARNFTATPRSPTATGHEWEPSVTGVSGNTYYLDLVMDFLVNWSDAHGGQVQDGVSFPVPAGLMGLPDAEWHKETLDVSAPYKRAYIRQIAEALGEVLVNVESILQRDLGITLDEVVEGIELFNEVEHGNRYARVGTAPGSMGHFGGGITGTAPVKLVKLYESYESSHRWGRTCFQAAHGLRSTLGGLANGDAIKIRLPGICSYADKVGDTWEERLESLRGLATGFVDEAVDYLTNLASPRVSEAEVLGYLPDLLQGIDYHWYHAGEYNDEDHVQHIGYLVTEVAEIEQTILTALDAAWLAATSRSDNVLSSFPVSVMENGCSATEGFVPTGLDPEMFQAFEVVRRLGGALASGAPMVGWHSWMSGDDGSFVAYGLREDTEPWNAPPEDAIQRLSWFTYQRLAELLGDVTSGSMVLPQVASRAELEAFFSSDSHDYVVLHFEGSFAPSGGTSSIGSHGWPTTLNHAWLVLRDPSLPGSSRFHLYATWASALGRVALSVPPISVPSGIAASAGSLPYLLPVHSRASVIDLRSKVEFALLPDDGPVLLFSDAMISWSVEL